MTRWNPRLFALSEPFMLRMFGKVNITLKSADVSHPAFLLPAVPKEPVAMLLRDCIEKARRDTGVRVEEKS